MSALEVALGRPTGIDDDEQAFLSFGGRGIPRYVLTHTDSIFTQVEASGWSRHQGAVAGVDYSSQLPAGWGGGSYGPGGGARGVSSSTSNIERHRAWKAFERRPISRAEAKALREVRISRGIRNRTRGSGAQTAAAALDSGQDFSSSCSASTSLGTTEENISLMSCAIADNSSEMSITTAPSSLDRPFREEELRSEKNWQTVPPANGDIANAIGNIQVSSSRRGGRHRHLRRSNSGPGSRLSPSLGNSAPTSRDYYSTAQQQQRRRQKGGVSSGREKNGSGAQQIQKYPNGAALGRNGTLGNGPHDDGDWSTAASSSTGTITPSIAPELRLDENSEIPRDAISVGVDVGGIRSGGGGGGGLSPGLKNTPLPEKEGEAAPSSGLGLGFNGESIFRLNGEADADDVMRAMMRLSSAPRTETGKTHGQQQRPPSHHRGTVVTSPSGEGTQEARATTSENRGKGGAPAASSVTSLADGVVRGICRGNTPGIKSRSRSGQAAGFVGGSPPEVQQTTFDIEVLTLQSEARSRTRQGSSRQGEGRAVARDRGGLGDTENHVSGPGSAPKHRRRRNDAEAAAVGQKGFMLTESQSAPSGISQRGSLGSFVSLNSGGGGGRGGGAGGRKPAESFAQTFPSPGVDRNRSFCSSITVSSASVASQPPPHSTSINAVGGASGFELHSESNVSNDITRGVLSRSGIATAGGKRGRPIPQQQQRQARTKTAPSQENSGTPSISGSRGGSKLAGSSQVKDTNKSHRSKGKIATGSGVYDARSGKTKPQRSSGLEIPRAVDEGDHRARDDEIGSYDDGEDGDDGDDKTTGEQMSAIIAGVTREAAESVASLGGISATNSPLIPEGLSRPSSSIETSGRSPPAVTKKVPLTQRSGGVGASTTGSDTGDKSSRGKGSIPTSNARERGRQTETVVGRGRIARGGAMGASTSAGLGGTSKQQSSKSGRSSSPNFEQPEGGASTIGRNDTTTGRLTSPDTTDSFTITGPEAPKAPGGCHEEDSPVGGDGALQPGGATTVKESVKDETGIVGTRAGGGPTTAETAVSRDTATGRNSGAQATEKQDNTGTSHGGAVISPKGKGASSRSSKVVGRRVKDTETSGPSSSGSSISSRNSNRSGDNNVRGSQSTKPGNQSQGKPMRSSTVRDGARREEVITRDDNNTARSIEASLPLLVNAAVSGGAQRDAQQHTPPAEENQGGGTGDGSETSRAKQLPRVSGAGGGRSKASAGAGKLAKHAIKVHSRPTRVESEDLQTTTEALTTHHISIDDLLKVQLP